MNELKSKVELSSENIIGVKVVKTRNINNKRVCNCKNISKFFNQTMYLKVCWHCGRVFESKQSNTLSCSTRCSQNITRRRKAGLNPLANMVRLTKVKNTKDIIDRFGYL